MRRNTALLVAAVLTLGRTVTAPFSDGVLVGDTLYLAGRIGLDPAAPHSAAKTSGEASAGTAKMQRAGSDTRIRFSAAC